MAHIAVERRSLSMEKWSSLLFEKVEQCIIRERYPIDGWEIRNGQYFAEGYVWEDEAFASISDGEMWGGPDVTSVFRCNFSVPSCMDGKELWFYMLTSSEVIVSEDGKYLDGIDPNRSWFKLIANAKTGESHSLMLEAYTRSKPDDDRNTKTRKLKGCIQNFKRPELIVIDHKALSVKYDLDMLYQCAYATYIHEDIKQYYRYHIEEIVKLLPAYDCGTEAFRNALPILKKYLNDKVYQAQHPYGKNGNLACVAHSHLDIAYHWKVEQTIQKNARTVLIQLRLMERHPEFKYAHTQAWTYEMLEKYYPQLFDELKQRINEGRWEIVGGMYVEPDCNVISAESMVRQILYGKQYFYEKFGIVVDNCWLPDVFGNSAIMPQILKSGGIDYFVSNKMSTWNDTNLFPHNNFIWRGLDGTEVNACVPPVHFITWMEPDQAIENWDKYQDKEICPESLQMYGYGDGGSGATDEMLEYFERQQHLPGIPNMRITTGKEYLYSAFKNAQSFPVWDGDLYLEMHRGTFTTKAQLKRYNRQGEFLAQETETLSTFSSIISNVNSGIQKQLSTPWKKLLLNQFHDILPGSHTAPVAEDAVNTYEQMIGAFESIKKHAVDAITIKGEKQSYVAINTFSDARGKTAYLDFAHKDIKSIIDNEGNSYPVQKQIRPDGGESACCIVPKINGMSIASFKADNAPASSRQAYLYIDKNNMENQFVKLKIEDNGRIISIFDKTAKREIIPNGSEANEWQLFNDYPGMYNAWDILESYKDSRVDLPLWSSVEVVETGPVSVALRLERSFGQSMAVQIIRLYAERKRIDFETWIDWREDQKLLKVAFPLNIKSRIYTVDTSAGVLERLNNRNTTWEQARFEVPCHKWVDMSEGLFGVSIMNDCKYGCDVSDNVIRLSLLRAPIRPDRESDRGEQYFTYSLYAHNGSWQKDGVVEEAFDLNYPLKLIQGKTALKNDWKAFEINNPALKCQAFKISEDSESCIIIRLIELYGSHGEAIIKPGFQFGRAFLCNIIEEDLQEAETENNEIKISFKPYQVINIKIYR